MLGVVLGLSAGVGFGASDVFARLSMQHIHATSGTLVSLIVGTLLTTALAFGFHTEEILGLVGVAFLWFLVSGLINFPLGRLLNFLGVSMVGVSRSAPIVGASPLISTIIAVSVTGETINGAIALGTACIIGGLALILSQR